LRNAALDTIMEQTSVEQIYLNQGNVFEMNGNNHNITETFT